MEDSPLLVLHNDAKIKYKIKGLPYILGANCVNFWRVCGFISFVQFVDVVLFPISLAFVPLLTDS